MTYDGGVTEEANKASLHPHKGADTMTTTATPARHWYAIEWTYGIGTYWEDDPLPCGAVRIFDTEQARDQWAAHDPDLRRSAIDSSTATRMMRAAIQGLPFDHDDPTTTKQLIDMYRHCYDPYCMPEEYPNMAEMGA